MTCRSRGTLLARRERRAHHAHFGGLVIVSCVSREHRDQLGAVGQHLGGAEQVQRVARGLLHLLHALGQGRFAFLGFAADQVGQQQHGAGVVQVGGSGSPGSSAC